MTTRLMVTGSSGFVGGHLVKMLAEDSCYELCALVRRLPEHPVGGVDYQVLADFLSLPPHYSGFRGVEAVIHLASRVHVMNELSLDPLAAFRQVNVEQTVLLARSAAAAGVKRFVFISSVKVNGEHTKPGQPYLETDLASPSDPYGVSKLEAEEALRVVAAETGLEVVILRPVLVYGAGVKANFETMMKWVKRGIPLPFGAIENLRSFVAIENLISLVVMCIEHPAAANQTFLISDGEDVSTTELLRRLARALNVKDRLIPVPGKVLSATAALLGKPALAQRLCGSLQVDISKARTLLNWTPVVTLDQALDVTARHFLAEKN
ncbi:UDP-glucose 4-epimerase family protein [Pseudomonas sp. GXZC]|uniref:UDP-glucose 4-epimerase family protein n=1 Tax=Pseudomonas sp. GXZC TaxID=3003351 RepID=UPI0022AA9B07|nr:SDR family oxidoreductase [Pseudomonas sp. GXZC]WAT30632.1 SDR family oxidoreductase [Pseudomonas sp. GXZC]